MPRLLPRCCAPPSTARSPLPANHLIASCSLQRAHAFRIISCSPPRRGQLCRTRTALNELPLREADRRQRVFVPLTSGAFDRSDISLLQHTPSTQSVPGALHYKRGRSRSSVLSGLRTSATSSRQAAPHEHPPLQSHVTFGLRLIAFSSRQTRHSSLPFGGFAPVKRR